MTLRQIALQITATLRSHHIRNAPLEAELLIRHALQYDRSHYFASQNLQLTHVQTACINALAERRISAEPLPYITGHREFYGIDLIVNPHVLIPRQETELLVDEALRWAQSQHVPLTVVDVGTGSGAIAIALARNLGDADIYAIDISTEALNVADCNRRRLGVVEQITLLHGDLLEPLAQSADLIVSNPPYISSHLIDSLQSEVRSEPFIALDGGANGLQVVRRLLAQAPSKLKPKGCMLVEVSPEQMSSVCDIARIHFPDADICHAKDMLGLPRCVIIRTN